MNNVELVRQRDAFLAVVARASDLGEPELLGHWGRYLCVLAAGFLENSIRIIFYGRAARRSSKDVAAFVRATLERVQNPKASAFIEIAGKFDSEWAKAVEAVLSEDDGRRKNAIDSIMNNRHLIAHGKNSNISVAQIKQYFSAVLEVVDHLERVCDQS